jgi:hypothetical protein
MTNAKTRQAASRPHFVQPRRLRDVLRLCVNQCLFTLPVNLDQFPSYTKYVKMPMCLNDIAQNLLNNAYDTRAEVVEDLELVWKNAQAFNPSGTFVHGRAEDLQRRCSEMIKDLDDEQGNE